MTNKPPQQPAAPDPTAEEYRATDEEVVALKAFQSRKKRLAPRIKIEMTSKTVKFQPEHPDADVGHAVIMSALGTADLDFYNPLLVQLANAGSKGSTFDERGLNFMLSVVKGIEPRDQVEVMLAAQMAAVHMTMMTFTRRLAQVENLQQQDGAERAFNKLARTFTMQTEALKRYRSTGEQKMTVEHQHVTVNDGGQAIVGNVTTGGGVGKNNEGQPHGTTTASITHAPGEALPSDLQAVGEAVLLARR